MTQRRSEDSPGHGAGSGFLHSAHATSCRTGKFLSIPSFFPVFRSQDYKNSKLKDASQVVGQPERNAPSISLSFCSPGYGTYITFSLSCRTTISLSALHCGSGIWLRCSLKRDGVRCRSCAQDRSRSISTPFQNATYPLIFFASGLGLG